MQVKELKVDGEGKEFVHTFLLRTEIIEGGIIYIHSRMLECPLNQKTKFNIGSIHLFTEENGIKCYKSEMSSLDSLNREIDWNQKYFDQLHLTLSKPTKDITFSLSNGQDDIISCDLVLRIHEKLQVQRSITEVCLLKVYLRHMPQHSNLDTFYRLCHDQINRRNQFNQQLENKMAQTQQQNQSLINDLQMVAEKAKLREQEILAKFVVLINEKKRHIKELSQFNNLANHQIQDAIQEEIQPSQFEPSEPFDASFFFTQNGNEKIGEIPSKKFKS